MSGIDKGLCFGFMKIIKFGFEGDEYDLVFYGGFDKVIFGCEFFWLLSVCMFVMGDW